MKMKMHLLRIRKGCRWNQQAPSVLLCHDWLQSGLVQFEQEDGDMGLVEDYNILDTVSDNDMMDVISNAVGHDNPVETGRGG